MLGNLNIQPLPTVSLSRAELFYAQFLTGDTPRARHTPLNISSPSFQCSFQLYRQECFSLLIYLSSLQSLSQISWSIYRVTYKHLQPGTNAWEPLKPLFLTARQHITEDKNCSVTVRSCTAPCIMGNTTGKLLKKNNCSYYYCN